MIEKHRLEQAALHAVDLLDPAERQNFESELRINRELQHGLREFHDIVAAVSKTAPQHAPPALNLGSITATAPAPITQKISPQAKTNGHASKIVVLADVNRSHRPVLPWAVAAACAVLASWFASQAYVTQRELHTLQVKLPPPVPSTTPSSSNGSTNDNSVVITPGTPTVEGGHELLPRNPTGTREVRLIQDRERLQLEIQKIKHAHSMLTDPQDGVLQMKLVELRSPQTKPGTTPSAHQLLDRITEAVRASLPNKDSVTPPPTDTKDATPPAKATPTPTPPKVSAHGVGADQELEISGPVNLKALNLSPDQRVVYREGFSAGDYQELNDGVWWDENRNFVWRKQPDGSVVGQQPPPQWSPEGETPPLRVSAAIPPEVTQPPTDNAPITTNSPTPAIESWTFVDGPRGDGTIIVQNMPAPASGQIHALWSQETITSAPVFRGYFPELTNGSGMISFSLPPGTPPATFMVTTEAASANSVPTSPSPSILLLGP
jgi:hypothetical protein